MFFALGLVLVALAKAIEPARFARSKLCSPIFRHRFKTFGAGSSFDPFGIYSYETISVGRNTSLRYRPVLIASRSFIRIGTRTIIRAVVCIGEGAKIAAGVVVNTGVPPYAIPAGVLRYCWDDATIAEHKRLLKCRLG